MYRTPIEEYKTRKITHTLIPIVRGCSPQGDTTIVGSTLLVSLSIAPIRWEWHVITSIPAKSNLLKLLRE